MEFQQIKTGIGNYTQIDDDTINKIACIQAFKSDEMNKMLHKNHQDLLRYAMNKNDNMEVGFFWDLNNIEKPCLKIKGKINGFNIHDNSEINSLVKYSNSIASVVIMHNHPRNGLFSGADIKSFIDFNSIYLMTAVCNDGTIYMLRKEYNFNPFLLEYYYSEGVKISLEATRREQLAKAKKQKLNYNNPKHRNEIAKIQTKPYYYGIKNVAKHAKEIGVTYRCSVKRK